jgi:hypothetical protein
MEWYPYKTNELLIYFPISLLAMVIGYTFFTPDKKKLPEKATFFFFFATTILIASFTAKRYSEYFPPFTILFAAFSLESFLSSRSRSQNNENQEESENIQLKETRENPQDIQDNTLSNKTKQLIFSIILFIVFVAIMFFYYIGVEIGSFKWLGLIEFIQNNPPNSRYERAMEWAKANIPENEIIFNCNWDDFPKLFYLDTTHRYVYGLDPNYLYSKNPDLFKLVDDITKGKVDDPAPIIREKIGSNYIFSDAKDCTDFIAKALESGWFDIAYEDDEAYFLRLRKEKGQPPNLEDEEKETNEMNKANNSTEEENNTAQEEPEEDDSVQ